MDEIMTKLHDSVVEEEIARSYRVKEVPARIVALLELAHADTPKITPFHIVKFSRLTPRASARIGELTATKTYDDMQDKKLLNHAQLLKINIERGSWTEAEDERIKELQTKLNAEMMGLWLQGFDQQEKWLQDLIAHSDAFLAQVSEENKAKATLLLDRWLNYTDLQQERYNTDYAAEQGGEVYSPENDFIWLSENATSDESMDELMEAENLKNKIIKLGEITTLRIELNDLIEKKAKIFGTSIESRRDRTAELSQVYFGVQRCNADGKTEGPLTPDFDDLLDLPDSVIEWLLTEAYYFFSGVPDITRKYLEAWGFTQAERVSGSEEVSEELPVPPPSKTDSQPVTETVVSSTELVAVKS